MNLVTSLSALIAVPIFCALGALSAPAEAAVQGKTFEYRDGDTALQGYLAYDDAVKTPRPGILLVHDWMGERPLMEQHARDVAKLGYVVLAADIYGKDVRPQNTQEAMQQAGKYRGDIPLLRSRATSGLNALKALPQVNPQKLGAMGYCFGGGVALELARSGAPLTGVVTLHGNLNASNPADAQNIKAKILVLHGADDPHVPPAQVAAFQDEMRAAKVDYQIVAYGGAVHSFTEPEANNQAGGAAYNREADQRSFRAMTDFWAEVFGG